MPNTTLEDQMVVLEAVLGNSDTEDLGHTAIDDIVLYDVSCTSLNPGEEGKSYKTYKSNTVRIKSFDSYPAITALLVGKVQNYIRFCLSSAQKGNLNWR